MIIFKNRENYSDKKVKQTADKTLTNKHVEVAEWTKAADSGSVIRGFESHPLYFYYFYILIQYKKNTIFKNLLK